MTMRAKYAGTCRKCGGAIATGDEIEWTRETGACHVECPIVKSETPDANTIRISQGEGYGGREYRVGEVLRHRKHGIIVVLSASSRYVREDGMSFGVGDESGYIYSATCRPATDEEAAPLLADENKKVERKQIGQRLGEIAGMIQRQGKRPVVSNVEGERVLGKPDIYGGGHWFIIAPDHIWYVENNGSDGANWANTNIGVPGYAGEIGWCIPFDAALADELRKIAAMFPAPN